MRRWKRAEVVLVGGLLQQMLQELFDGKELSKTVHPDEAVAYGAAVLAAKLSGNDKMQKLILLDVTPLSLGISINGGLMSVFIPRNTTIPTRTERIHKTMYDNQTSMIVPVYEGERSEARENNLLGQFTLRGIPAAPRGDAKFKMCIDIDENGVMNVSAEHIGTGLKKNITITNYKGRLSEEEIAKMVKDAEKYKREDEEYRKKVDARIALEDYAYNMRNATRCANGIGAADKEEIEKAFESTMKWLESNKLVKVDTFKEKKKELKRIYNPIVAKMHLS